ncbi:AVN_collapsed_G0040680.mRNA.1.CDS.1 [Saccharomyces cerevisiae]|nr:ANM_HP_G0003200.mRNA.1.CDS.1 [Saccharomyces cerevisiae]CAI5223628.1 ANM_HP_G0056570.mRNA.1.CDS.1 [Saccharomyces cerevisiae]CAI6840738.1 ANM_collapsed_G0041700.mRNA.1.CDS.1 [Saccharomyces cerevisiae]CAI7028188.1 ANM_HP_G0003200.mRNA.1.CDS.1 [Saccharomyces cerevisiae]CAI7028444.1 ANM_HP_G0056570.mRNA.1.CDS.1 [Saccharomyces cerevisiae]
MSFYSNLPSAGQSSRGSSTSGRNGVGLEPLYPTIFEIMSSQEIDSLLPASIRYLLANHLVANFPNRYTLRLNKYFFEWFQAIKGFVEWYHLKTYNSTFIDRFYGLQLFSSRDRNLALTQCLNPKGQSEWPQGLQLNQQQKSVIFLENIILPYITAKLDEILEKISMNNIFSSDETENKWPKRAFLRIYPFIKKLLALSNLLVKLLFLTKRTGSVSLLQYLFKIEYTTVRPLSSELSGLKETKGMDNRLRKTNISSIFALMQGQLSIIPRFLTFMGSQFFPTFIFVLRVYQWWTTQDMTTKLQKRVNDLDEDIPRPPFSSHSDKTEDKEGVSEACPVCEKTVQNPCVLETGYVACYPCAISYLVNNEGHCPVTNKKLLGCTYNKHTNKWEVVTGIRKLLI